MDGSTYIQSPRHTGCHADRSFHGGTGPTSRASTSDYDDTYAFADYRAESHANSHCQHATFTHIQSDIYSYFHSDDGAGCHGDTCSGACCNARANPGSRWNPCL